MPEACDRGQQDRSELEYRGMGKVIMANVSDVVRFRTWMHNNGVCCNLTGIVVNDTLSEGLEYVGNAEPALDGVVNNADGTTTLYWNFAGPIGCCENITVEFDARKTKTRKDRNCVNVSAWCNETEAHVQVFDDDCAVVRRTTDSIVIFMDGRWNVDTNMDQQVDISFQYGRAGSVPLFGNIK